MEFLGEAMDVKRVAELIGCSAWTVRQKHVKAGLPCFRTGPSGRMIFYRNQVDRLDFRKTKRTERRK